MAKLRKLTVLVDDNEQYPILFPRTLCVYPKRSIRKEHVEVYQVDTVDDIVLPFGDYAIKGYEYTWGIERKGSLSELHQNLLTKDRARFLRALDRFVANVRYPYLLLDCTPASLATKTRFCPEPALVCDALFNHLVTYLPKRVGLIWGGFSKAPTARRCLGEHLLRIGLAHIQAEERPNGKT